MRTTLVFLALVVAAAIAGGMFADSKREASPSTESVAAAVVPYTEIARGTQSAVDRRVNYLITSKEALAELWKMVKAEGKVPAVDFETHVVAAVFAGEQPTAGYDIAVERIEDADKRIVVVKIAKPGEGCVLAESLTAPYQIISLPKTSLPFTHEDTWTTVPCES